MYYVPDVLQRLSHAEQMLIQKVSPFLSLHHIKNGTLALTGHVCAFEQDIGAVAEVLPRAGRDTTVIKVIQEITTEIGNDTETRSKVFRVRRAYVLEALQWLKVYNKDYASVTIDVSRLDWVVGDESDLEGYAFQASSMKTNKDDTVEDTDMGCALRQCVEPRMAQDDIQCFGYVEEGGRAILNIDDSKIASELRETIADSPNKSKMTMDWPEIKATPVSEYCGHHIFTGAFPWLFPGGYGDIVDYANPDQVIAEWGRRLLYYEDGRFAKDKLFTFFVMNYIIRHRNSSSGKFFIGNFQKNVPDTLEELKAAIKEGNTSFVNHLTYWNKRIKGSSPYWHQKRTELYAWINQHIELGNGPPMYFITLSCAEYFWPDVISLLRDRLKVADLDDSDCYAGSPKLIQLINDYTIVVQEYFQKRTEAWLETVGKEVFDIKHYWARYEFAPGRGQIHVHLLAIPNDHDIYTLCHSDSKKPNGEQLRAERLANWAEEKFGMTASVDAEFDTRCVGAELEPKRCKCKVKPCTGMRNPVTLRFSDIKDDDASLDIDGQALMQYCQGHDCSKFCMREGNSKR